MAVGGGRHAPPVQPAEEEVKENSLDQKFFSNETILQRGLQVGQIQASRSKAAVAYSFNVIVHTIQNVMVRFCQTRDVNDRQKTLPSHTDLK